MKLAREYKLYGVGGLMLILLLSAAPLALAEETAVVEVGAMRDALQMNLNIVWTCLAAFLVFFMQAGFAMVESGFTRAKNAVNIIMKNL
ncbi:MAG: ammonium transporter, partial [Lentisphaerae bacterium]|nr:ammonium transporter [Lentisphaerota bacterium]